jgi:hypothetical protein
MPNNEQLEAVRLHNGTWAVRPKGQLGTMGWSPAPWTVAYTKANNEADAIKKACQFVFSRRRR